MPSSVFLRALLCWLQLFRILQLNYSRALFLLNGRRCGKAQSTQASGWESWTRKVFRCAIGSTRLSKVLSLRVQSLLVTCCTLRPSWTHSDKDLLDSSRSLSMNLSLFRRSKMASSTKVQASSLTDFTCKVVHSMVEAWPTSRDKPPRFCRFQGATSLGSRIRSLILTLPTSQWLSPCTTTSTVRSSSAHSRWQTKAAPATASSQVWPCCWTRSNECDHWN